MQQASIIYKYPLPMVGNVLELPVGAQLLDVAFQGENLFVWARVHADPHAITSKRRFLVMPTGMEIPSDDELNYIGTAHHASGRLVFHIFEVV